MRFQLFAKAVDTEDSWVVKISGGAGLASATCGSSANTEFHAMCLQAKIQIKKEEKRGSRNYLKFEGFYKGTWLLGILTTLVLITHIMV